MTSLLLSGNYLVYPDIASLAENYVDLLTPDSNCEYDQFIEINLDEVNIT